MGFWNNVKKIFMGSKPVQDKSCIMRPVEPNIPFVSESEPKFKTAQTTYQELPTFKYDISKMRFLYHADPNDDIYGIPIEYRNMIADDLMQINMLLDEACTKCSVVPQRRIIKEQINFKPKREMDDDFTRFVYTPYTKTGKISKYPYFIKFALNDGFLSGNGLFGDIYFTKHNQIGKAWLVSWSNHNCYTINCAIKEKRLQVTRIDVAAAGEYSKTCLYNYNNK